VDFRILALDAAGAFVEPVHERCARQHPEPLLLLLLPPPKQVTDLHRHFIDDITIPSSQGKGVLRRVDDVFDCWFESGSMPYGQVSVRVR
jgi:isoleucyl-tRNA synthetase